MAKDDPGTDVAVVDRVRSLIVSGSDEDPADIAARIDAAILTADSVDDVFNGNRTLGLKDIANVIVDVNAIIVREGKPEFNVEENSLGVFIVLETSLGIVTLGARTPVLKLARAAELAQEGKVSFPLKLRFYEGSETQAGRRPWDVELMTV
jgi:hypothetical protein